MFGLYVRYRIRKLTRNLTHWRDHIPHVRRRSNHPITPSHLLISLPLIFAYVRILNVCFSNLEQPSGPERCPNNNSAKMFQAVNLVYFDKGQPLQVDTQVGGHYGQDKYWNYWVCISRLLRKLLIIAHCVEIYSVNNFGFQFF